MADEEDNILESIIENELEIRQGCRAWREYEERVCVCSVCTYIHNYYTLLKKRLGHAMRLKKTESEVSKPKPEKNGL